MHIIIISSHPTDLKEAFVNAVHLMQKTSQSLSATKIHKQPYTTASQQILKKHKTEQNIDNTPPKRIRNNNKKTSNIHFLRKHTSLTQK